MRPPFSWRDASSVDLCQSVDAVARELKRIQNFFDILRNEA